MRYTRPQVLARLQSQRDQGKAIVGAGGEELLHVPRAGLAHFGFAAEVVEFEN